MVEINMPSGALYKVSEWCETHVSPRTYWMHNRIGGNGWQMYTNATNKRGGEQWKLKFWDGEMAVVFKLSFDMSEL